jgi:hypothetical protein
MTGFTAKRPAAWLLTILVTFCAPPLRADITPEARVALDRYLAATGGREAAESIRSTHVKAKIKALGLEGTTESWTRLPDHHATETQLGPFKILEGYDGHVAWRTDPSSGKPVKLDGKDLEEAVASVWYDNERWLAPDQGGGKVAITGTEKDSAGAYTVIEVTPPVGRPRRFYLNQRTDLIDRATSKRDQLEIVSRFSDYRSAAGGRKVAYLQLTQIIGMPANDLRVEIESVAVNEAAEEARFAFPGGETASDVTWLKTPGIARLAFDYSTRHLWLKASVNGGPPVDFLYDTGASITVIDSAFAAKVGLKTEGALQGQGAGSTGMASFSRLETLRVAGADGDGIEVRDQKVAVLSINSHLAPFFWRDCAGVIGYDFISRFVSEIDYDAETLTLHDPKTWKYAGSGAALPFTLAGTVPVVKMKLDGAYEGDFRIDVGSSSTVDLHGPFVKQHELDKKIEGGVLVTGGGFGGTFSNRLVRMKTIELGPYSWKDPLVSLSAAESGAFASEDYAGNIGNRILERFRLTIDYERRLVHLEPGPRFKDPDRFSRSGVQLARFGDEVQAMQVLPKSPAAQAGLVSGDRVVAINGKPATSYTVDQLEDLFEMGAPGKSIAFEVERDGKKKKLAVKLAEIL